MTNLFLPGSFEGERAELAELARYRLLCELNRKEIFGESVSEEEKADANSRNDFPARPAENYRTV